MALYSTYKYGGAKYGNSSWITETTAGFKAAQAALVRKLYGTLKIVSHFLQIGRAVTYPTTLFIGGNNHKRVAQKFVCPTSFTCASVQVMMKGASTNTGKIVVEIQTDNAGEPSGTAVANASRSDVDAVVYATQKWYTITFNGTVGLVAGTVYWLVVKGDDTTADTTYIAADDRGGNDEAGLYTLEYGIYGTFKYGDGTKYGSSWASDWTATSYVLCCRLVSATEAENIQTITEMISWESTRDKDIACYSFDAQLVNKNYQYSLGQIYSDYLSAGKKIYCYLGLEVSSKPVYYLAFLGETDNSDASGDIVSMQARCLMKKLLDHRQTFSGLGATAYEDIIQSVASNAGITAYDLRATGKTSIAGLKLQEITAYDACEKVREATIDRMQFYNTETLTTTARAKATVSEATVPTYELADDDFIVEASVNEVNDKLVNRATVTNDEDGETTTDGNPLDIDDYQTVGTEAGSLLATERTKDIVVTLTENPVMYTAVNDAESDCEITAVDIDCGTSAAVGSVTITLRNKNYPSDAGDYDLTVNACPVLNASATTHIGETLGIVSWNAYGKYPQRFDNKIIASKANAEALADAIVAEKGEPIQQASLTSRGIVDIYPDDIIRVVEGRKTKLNHLVIVTMCQLRYTVDPASFLMTLVGEKTNYVGA